MKFIKNCMFRAISESCIGHTLPYELWLESKAAGWYLPEASPYLRAAADMSDVGGVRPTHVLGDHGGTLWRREIYYSRIIARQLGWVIGESRPTYAGYAWYDSLPVIDSMCLVIGDGENGEGFDARALEEEDGVNLFAPIEVPRLRLRFNLTSNALVPPVNMHVDLSAAVLLAANSKPKGAEDFYTSTGLVLVDNSLKSRPDTLQEVIDDAHAALDGPATDDYRHGSLFTSGELRENYSAQLREVLNEDIRTVVLGRDATCVDVISKLFDRERRRLGIAARALSLSADPLGLPVAHLGEARVTVELTAMLEKGRVHELKWYGGIGDKPDIPLPCKVACFDEYIYLRLDEPVTPSAVHAWLVDDAQQRGQFCSFQVVGDVLRATVTR
jgi:hypothetical protein